MGKKTVEDLERMAKEAERRAKELRAKARKQTQAEEAKLNSEIIKAMEEWRVTLRQVPARKDLPRFFREWAQKNVEKKEQV